MYDRKYIDQMAQAMCQALRRVTRNRNGASYTILDAVYGPIDPEWARYNRSESDWRADRITSAAPRILWRPRFNMICLTSDDGRVPCTFDGPSSDWYVSSNTIHARRANGRLVEVYRDHSGASVVEGPWWDTITELASGAETRANAAAEAFMKQYEGRDE